MQIVDLIASTKAVFRLGRVSEYSCEVANLRLSEKSKVKVRFQMNLGERRSKQSRQHDFLTRGRRVPDSTARESDLAP